MSSALVIRAATATDMHDVRTLFREYATWLGVDLCFQGFEQELEALPGRYAPPSGRLLLAELWDGNVGRVAGAIALRDLGDGVCEMKRLYVREFARGHGAGRALTQRLLAEARATGYRAMRLDTLPSMMASANALYESLGFRDIAAYYANPVPGVRYLECDLTM